MPYNYLYHCVLKKRIKRSQSLDTGDLVNQEGGQKPSCLPAITRAWRQQTLSKTFLLGGKKNRRRTLLGVDMKVVFPPNTDGQPLMGLK